MSHGKGGIGEIGILIIVILVVFFVWFLAEKTAKNDENTYIENRKNPFETISGFGTNISSGLTPRLNP